MANKRKTPTTSNPSTNASTASKSSSYPAPFTPAPSQLAPLLPQLDPSKVYLTHIDTHPRATKQTIFLAALGLNSTIALLLLWRAWRALPTYLAMVEMVVGERERVGETMGRKGGMAVLGRRVAMMVLDFLVFRFVGPWPLSYFTERPSNPVTWRWRVGFKAQEVVVRVSRNWKASDLMEGTKKGQDSAFFKTRVQKAVDGMMVDGGRGKTGYLMMDGDWDLEFGVMEDAHVLLKREEIKAEDLDKVVLVCYEDKWLAWRFDDSTSTSDSSSSSGESENQKKMMAFKDLLTSMGKESLFWKWQEIVEAERSSVDGGFDEQAQKRVQEKVSQAFGREGVDFEEVMGGVGVVEAPGK